MRSPGRPSPGCERRRADRTGNLTGAYYHAVDAHDAQLLAEISSDATGEALRALYRSYAGELYGFALNALGERGTAEEIVQEVFTRAWRHAEAYDPTRGSVRTWLYQIARHAIIDMRRRAAVRPALALHEPRDEQDPEGLSIEQAMLGWQVASALERLTPEHRQMIRLAHFQGLSMREIAERLRAARGDREEPHVVRAAIAAAGLRGDGGAGMTHVHEDIGAYVLGALDADAESGVREHLRDVPRVRGRARRARRLPGLLDLAVVTGATDDEPLPPAIEERLLDRFARERVERPPRRRWRPRIALGVGGALAGAAIAVAALVLGLNFERNGGRPASQYQVAFEKRRQRPANATARAGLRSAAVGHRGAPVGATTCRRPGDVYEVRCDAQGWSASAGTFRVDAQGRRLRDPDDRGQDGPVRRASAWCAASTRRAARSCRRTSSTAKLS